MPVYDNFFRVRDRDLWKSSLAILCNQSSFDFRTGQYFLKRLEKEANLKTVLSPEHGLYSELQDQVSLDQTGMYRFLSRKLKFISLYGSRREDNDELLKESLKNIDVLVIDLQDIGSRYYTYIPLVDSIFKVIQKHRMPVKIYLIDRPNPAGRQVEGTPLKKEYESLIGLEGIPHRHGLTIGEMCSFLRDRMNGGFKLNIIKYPGKELAQYPDINPSPNINGPTAVRLYPGTCLLEGTNISEGRGTTRPFEYFGAPYMDFVFTGILKRFNKKFKGVLLRPMIFIPAFHKYAGAHCYGCQVHLTGKKLHSLFFGLDLIRFIHEFAGSEFKFREGPYETGSDKKAIEILAGDKTLLDYLELKINSSKVKNLLEKEEHIWVKKATEYLLYKEKLFSIKTG